LGLRGDRLTTMPRYVILEHDYPILHWDLMLQAGDILRTWRLAQLPAANQDIAAEMLSDHRKAYLDYEGPVSGNRGSVHRWDQGIYTGEVEASEEITLLFDGERLQGPALLRRENEDCWVFVFTGTVAQVDKD
jgi:hypothetical protein